jgi:hypothetical protein
MRRLSRQRGRTSEDRCTGLGQRDPKSGHKSDQDGPHASVRAATSILAGYWRRHARSEIPLSAMLGSGGGSRHGFGLEPICRSSNESGSPLPVLSVSDNDRKTRDTVRDVVLRRQASVARINRECRAALLLYRRQDRWSLSVTTASAGPPRRPAAHFPPAMWTSPPPVRPARIRHPRRGPRTR